MITGTLRSKIDQLWSEFWKGGITNPLMVIEQISFLMFSRLLDIRENTEEKRWNRTPKNEPFPGVMFTRKQQHLRWSHFRELGGEEMLRVVRDEVFPHFRALGGLPLAGSQRTRRNGDAESGGNTFAELMKDAQLMIQKPSLLVSAVNLIQELPLIQGNTKVELYEYLLEKLTTAGINGQFRTPRHIISLMVDIVAPEPTWVIADPVCGTGSYLVGVIEYLRRKYASMEGRLVEKTPTLNRAEGQGHERFDEQVAYNGDLLDPYRKHILSGMLHGFDFDVTMLRITAMNLLLQGVDSPGIHYQDTLSNTFPEKLPQYASDHFDLILATPPFRGTQDESDVHKSLLGKVRTRKTELLFLVLFLRMLKQGGRCAVIVPEGVLSGSSTAHVATRELLVKENQLQAVIKLPAGIFKPYAGVSTAILLFSKGGKTKDVFFYDVRADGFSLGDKRTKVAEDDLPDVREKWMEWQSLQSRHASSLDSPGKKAAASAKSRADAVGSATAQSAAKRAYFSDRAAKAFAVPMSEIAENRYDLSLNRYKEVVHEEVKCDPPKIILARLKSLEGEIAKDLDELEAMLG